MAERDVQSLFLQVDASVELLRKNLAAGEQPLSRFEQRADQMSKKVDSAIGVMGKRFGEFSKLAEDAATKAERSFNDSFSAIQKAAATAIQGPIVKGGGPNIGAADARAAADAARQQALAIGLIEQAAHRAAAGEGELTAETRQYLAAAQAARIEAERNAAELTREAGALERLEIELRQTGAAQRLLQNGHRAGAVSAGQQRASMIQLGQQFQDFSVQVSSGQKISTAFTQQIGQAAFALQGMGGRLAGVAGFLTSFGGIATVVALTALGPLVAKIFEGNDAIGDAIDKLKQDAQESETTARAKERFRLSEEGVAQAIRESSEATKASFDALHTAAELANIQAKNNLANEKSIRRVTIALLEQAQAQAEAARGQTFGAAGGAGAGAAVALYSGRVGDLQRKVDAQNAAIVEAERRVNQTRVDLAVEAAKTESTAVGRITRQYDRKIQAKEREARIAAQAGKTIDAALTLEIRRLYERRDAAVASQRATEQAARSSARAASSGAVTPALVSQLLRDRFGGTVTSTTRSAQHNRDIGGAANSFHVRGQAVDFVPRGGVGSVSKSEIRDYLSSQGIDIKELLGPGDRGHGDHDHVAFGRTRLGQDAIDSRRATAARTVESTRLKGLADDFRYTDEERQARRRLIDATRKSADSEEQRDALLREDINGEADTQKAKIATQLSAKKISAAEAKHLNDLNERTRTQRLQNVTIDRATATIGAQYDAQTQTLDAQIATLRLQLDLATTNAQRRDIARQLLEAEQKQARLALERIRDTSDDPNQVQRAKDALKGLPAQQKVQTAQLANQNLDPLDDYRKRLHAATDDMHAALSGVVANGLGSLEDGLLGVVTGTETVAGAFKKMAMSILADLARIAIEKLIVKAIGTSFLGFSEGGSVQSHAEGGAITGPGSGTSNSILSWLSNGEFVIRAAQAKKFGPLLHAINENRLPRYALGGAVGSMPGLVPYRGPNLSKVGSSRRDRVQFDVRAKVEASPLLLARVEETSIRTVSAAAEPIMDGAQQRTFRALQRERLPGGGYG